jgi:hypothetical protein
MVIVIVSYQHVTALNTACILCFTEHMWQGLYLNIVPNHNGSILNIIIAVLSEHLWFYHKFLLIRLFHLCDCHVIVIALWHFPRCLNSFPRNNISVKLLNILLLDYLFTLDYKPFRFIQQLWDRFVCIPGTFPFIFIRQIIV